MQIARILRAHSNWSAGERTPQRHFVRVDLNTRGQFLVKVGFVRELDDMLNAPFTASVEMVCHRRVPSETGQPHIGALVGDQPTAAADGPTARRIPVIDMAHHHETSTVGLHGNKYPADALLVRRKVLARSTPPPDRGSTSCTWERPRIVQLAERVRYS